MTIDEIREWAAIRPKQGTKEYGFVRRSRLESMIDTLLAELDEKEERLAIKEDALSVAIMVGEYATAKLRTATEALETAKECLQNNGFGKYYAIDIAAAALKEIEKEADNG